MKKNHLVSLLLLAALVCTISLIVLIRHTSEVSNIDFGEVVDSLPVANKVEPEKPALVKGPVSEETPAVAGDPYKILAAVVRDVLSDATFEVDGECPDGNEKVEQEDASYDLVCQGQSFVVSDKFEFFIEQSYVNNRLSAYDFFVNGMVEPVSFRFTPDQSLESMTLLVDGVMIFRVDFRDSLVGITGSASNPSYPLRQGDLDDETWHKRIKMIETGKEALLIILTKLCEGTGDEQTCRSRQRLEELKLPISVDGE